jgi:hypothetical protein
MEEEEEGEEAELMEGVGMEEETSQPKKRAVTQEKEPGGEVAITVKVPMVHKEDNIEEWPKVGGKSATEVIQRAKSDQKDRRGGSIK